jgi:SAM-dependent methyltransferase
MSQALRRLYGRVKAAYILELGYEVPLAYRSAFVHLGGSAEVQHIYRRWASQVPAGSPVLIVGAMGGRDFFLFKNLGYDVTAVDLGPQPDISPIVIANVEEPLPFEDGHFAIVLLGEVLEHLQEDVKALRNVRRVLQDEGRLIVSLPFFNDWEEGHMRVHSPTSGMRLLAMAGFRVVDFIERPAAVDPRWLKLNYPIHALSAAWFMLAGRTIYAASTSLYGRFAVRVGRQQRWRVLRRRSRYYGGYYLCVKAAGRLDHVSLNRRLYTDSGSSELSHD